MTALFSAVQRPCERGFVRFGVGNIASKQNVDGLAIKLVRLAQKRLRRLKPRPHSSLAQARQTVGRPLFCGAVGHCVSHSTAAGSFDSAESYDSEEYDADGRSSTNSDLGTHAQP